MTEVEIFDSTDPMTNATDVYQFTAVANLYNALEIIALDAFEDRYEIFLLPLSFTAKGKKSLQKALDNYLYAYAQKNDRPFLIAVFNQYEADLGKAATIDLLEWIRNVTDSSASSVARYLSYIQHDLRQIGRASCRERV